MRIVHLSDTHLGWSDLHHADRQGRNIRERDVYGAFARAIEKAIELGPDAVVHSGDLFHGVHPSSAALGVALDQARLLREAEIPYVVIAGNHSTPRGSSVEHPFSILERFGVEAVYLEPRVVRVEELAITAIPHSNDLQQMERWVAEARPLPAAEFNVLVLHAGLSGLSRVGAAEPASAEIPGELLELAAGFDYVALGHLHGFDRPRVNAVYSGSLEVLSRADESSEKAIVEVDLAADQMGEDFIRKHPIDVRPRVAFRVDGSSENLTEAICEEIARHSIKEALVRIEVGPLTLAAFAAIDRQRVAGALEGCLHHTIEAEITDPAAELAAAGPLELREFLAQRTPKGVETEEFIDRGLAYMKKAAEEIGA